MLSNNDIKEILVQFPKIEFAFAYGSGVVEQEGYEYKMTIDNREPRKKSKPSELPMIDLVFAVEDSNKFHEMNMIMNPTHYSPIVPLTSRQIASVQDEISASVWFNTLIPAKISRFPNRMMKYGVITKRSLIKDLLTWCNLYTAGRLQKPVQIIQSDPEVEHAINQNKESAIMASLLLMQQKFTEKDLYMTIASLSYVGDPRMLFGENPRKIKNLVSPVTSYYKDIYQDSLRKAISNGYITHCPMGSLYFHQDTSLASRQSLCSQLPPTLKGYLLIDRRSRFNVKPPSRAGIRAALAGIVVKSAVTQSLKGLITAGIQKCSIYIFQKLSKSIFKKPQSADSAKTLTTTANISSSVNSNSAGSRWMPDVNKTISQFHY